MCTYDACLQGCQVILLVARDTSLRVTLVSSAEHREKPIRVLKHVTSRNSRSAASRLRGHMLTVYTESSGFAKVRFDM